MMDGLARRVGRFPVEIPAALLAAAAVAFLTMIAPDWRLERLVGATGLGTVLPAARPPLGDTARLLLAGLGAAFTFALAWTGLRALEPAARLPEGFPAFRAEDLHPDAPRRRPIRAGEEFGAPDVLDLFEPLPNRLAAVAEAPLPTFLRPDPEPAVAAAPEPEPTRAEAPAPDLAEVAQAMEATPKPVAVPAQSVPELMARLERGLAARGGAPVLPVANEDSDEALRAIAAELRQAAGAR